MKPNLPWQEQLEIIDKTMRALSLISDPEELVNSYWEGIGDLVPVRDFLSVSRRGIEAPGYLVTRSSRFVEEINPWRDRHKLQQMSGGIAGEVLYANKPVFIEDLPSRLSKDDPAYFYLEGFKSAIALPQYDHGEGLNCTLLLVTPDYDVDLNLMPMMYWHGSLFGRSTQNLVLRNQLSEALARLDNELQVVGEIQRSLLPAELPTIPGVDLSAYYQSSARAGGDYYDVFELPGGRWGFFIADVSGHGTPAAVLMAIIRTLAHTLSDSHERPVEFLNRLNTRLVHSYNAGGAFITAFYGVLDEKTRELTYAVAGHNPPRLVRDSRVSEIGENSELPLGILDGQTYRSARMQLLPGDLLFLYTDGITEAMPAAVGKAPRELLGIPRLDKALVASASSSAETCIHAVRAIVADHCKGAPPNDDQTMLAVKLLRAQER
jgi:sigma-B regulation protein RsbU (phosphoserine phosphatase)